MRQVYISLPSSLHHPAFSFLSIRSASLYVYVRLNALLQAEAQTSSTPFMGLCLSVVLFGVWLLLVDHLVQI